MKIRDFAAASARALLLLLAVGAVSGAGASARAEEGLYRIPTGTYRAAAPPGWNGTDKLPLVLFLHGYGESSAKIVGDKDMVAAVTGLGALLVAADGVNHAWSHVGAPRHDRDDIAFLRAVIADAETRWPIDRARVYAAGFSVGASMVWDLACHASEGFAAFVPVSGAFWLPFPGRCESGPVNLRHTHGMADPLVPMTGRTLRSGATQGDVHKGWDILLATDRCAATPDRTFVETVGAWEKRLECEDWTSCASGRELELCMHDDGHDMEPAFLRHGLEWAMRFRAPEGR